MYNAKPKWDCKGSQKECEQNTRCSSQMRTMFDQYKYLCMSTWQLNNTICLRTTFFVHGTRINSRNYKETRLFDLSNIQLQNHAAHLHYRKY